MPVIFALGDSLKFHSLTSNRTASKSVALYPEATRLNKITTRVTRTSQLSAVPSFSCDSGHLGYMFFSGNLEFHDSRNAPRSLGVFLSRVAGGNKTFPQ